MPAIINLVLIATPEPRGLAGLTCRMNSKVTAHQPLVSFHHPIISGMAASPLLSMMKPSQSGYEMRLAGSIAVAPRDLSMSANIGRDIAKTRRRARG